MQRFKNALNILFGCALMGLAYSLFLIPHHFVPGGVSGIAMIANYFSKLPVGLTIMVLNVPIFLLGLKTMGKKYVLNSLAGMVVSSVFIDLFHEVLKVPRPPTTPSWHRSTAASCSASAWASSSAAGPRPAAGHHRHVRQQDTPACPRLRHS